MIPDESKPCQYCGKHILRAKYGRFFEPPSNYKKRKFCSHECAYKARMKHDPDSIPEYKICKNCRKLFKRPEVKPGKLINPSLWMENYLYCSRSCFHSDFHKSKKSKTKFSHESKPQDHAKKPWGFDGLKQWKMTEEEMKYYARI